jgi:transcriptional regulator with XRE-family HTH domain
MTMATSKFGIRLRQLRKETGMSQREVANRVNIDFTYLSKIESGVMPPPSEKVIAKLAKVLGADKDELITLAGKVPSDLSRILRDKEIVQILRSGDRDKLTRFFEEKKKD